MRVGIGRRHVSLRDVDGRDGQADGEGSAMPRIALDFDVPAMGLHDPPRGGEAQADAGNVAVASILQTMEGLEETRELLPVDADPFVGDRDPCLVAVLGQHDADAAALGRVLDGVVEEVRQHLPETRRIAVDVHALRDDDLDPMLVGSQLRHGTDFADERPQIEIVLFDLKPAGLDARRIEQVLELAIEPFGLLGDDGKALAKNGFAR